jgi:hypothetical protein
MFTCNKRVQHFFIYGAKSAAALDTLTSSVLWLVSICNEFVLIFKYKVMKQLWNMSIILRICLRIHLSVRAPFHGAAVAESTLM